jgi:hypothetical protein
MFLPVLRIFCDPTCLLKLLDLLVKLVMLKEYGLTLTPSDSDRSEYDVSKKLAAAIARRGPDWDYRHRYVPGRSQLVVGMCPPDVLVLFTLLLRSLLHAVLRQPVRRMVRWIPTGPGPAAVAWTLSLVSRGMLLSLLLLRLLLLRLLLYGDRGNPGRHYAD